MWSLTHTLRYSSEAQIDDVSGGEGLVISAVVQQDGGLPAIGCEPHLRDVNGGQHTHWRIHSQHLSLHLSLAWGTVHEYEFITNSRKCHCVYLQCRFLLFHRCNKCIINSKVQQFWTSILYVIYSSSGRYKHLYSIWLNIIFWSIYITIKTCDAPKWNLYKKT